MASRRPRTAEALRRVMERMVGQTRQADVSQEDWGELRRVLAAQAEAQRRTEER